MKQQTAVMAIAKAFRNWQREWDRYDKEGSNKPPSFDDFVRPFLQMEKEQIIKSFNEGTFYSDEKINAEQYYNEVYGGQGSPDTSPNTQNK